MAPKEALRLQNGRTGAAVGAVPSQGPPRFSSSSRQAAYNRSRTRRKQAAQAPEELGAQLTASGLGSRKQGDEGGRLERLGACAAGSNANGLREIEAQAVRAIRMREEAVRRLRICSGKMGADLLCQSGVLPPNEPLVRMFYRLVGMVRQSTLNVVESISCWERLSRAACPAAPSFVWDGRDYLESVGLDLAFLDELPGVRSRLRSVPATSDVFLRLLTPDGMPIQEVTVRELRMGGRLNSDALRIRMATRMLMRRNPNRFAAAEPAVAGAGADADTAGAAGAAAAATAAAGGVKAPAAPAAEEEPSGDQLLPFESYQPSFREPDAEQVAFIAQARLRRLQEQAADAPDVALGAAVGEPPAPTPQPEEAGEDDGAQEVWVKEGAYLDGIVDALVGSLGSEEGGASDEARQFEEELQEIDSIVADIVSGLDGEAGRGAGGWMCSQSRASYLSRSGSTRHGSAATAVLERMVDELVEALEADTTPAATPREAQGGRSVGGSGSGSRVRSRLHTAQSFDQAYSVPGAEAAAAEAAPAAS